MYCEKCGKMNADGAIFCAGCSSILRSRRQNTQQSESSTRRFSITDIAEESNNSVKEQVNTPVSEPVASKPQREPVKEAREVPLAVKEQRERREKRAIPREEEPKSAPYDHEPRRSWREEYIPEDDIYDDEDEKKTGSVWFGLLATASWLIFVAFAAIGIIGGGYLLSIGMSDGSSLSTFGGGAIIIIFVVLGLYILSKNMVQIKIARTLNELKYKK